MKKKSKAGMSLSIVLLVLSILMTLGIKFLFHACGAKEDGSYMTCHWAQQAVFCVAIVLLVQSILLLITKNKYVKAGISISMVPTAIAGALIPNTVIPLCMMADMRCRAIMRPATILLMILISVVALISTVVQTKGGAKDEDQK